MKYHLIILFCIGALCKLMAQDDEKIQIIVFAEPHNTHINVGDDFLQNKKWQSFEKGVYPIVLKANYRISIYDTLDLNIKRPAVSFKYKLDYTQEAKLYNHNLIKGAVPLLVFAGTSTIMAGKLTELRNELKTLATTIETQPTAKDALESYNDLLPNYNKNRVYYTASNIGISLACASLFYTRQNRRALRTQLLKKRFEFNTTLTPYNNPNFGLCGMSLFISY